MWSLLTVDLIADDARLDPAVIATHPDREEARIAMAGILLTEAPALVPKWRAGAREDTVYMQTPAGLRAWAIYPHGSEKTREAAEHWMRDFVDQIGLRSQLPALTVSPVRLP